MCYQPLETEMKEDIHLPKPTNKAYALLFGVEKYMETRLDDVRYAEKDATAVCNALLDIGFEEENVELVLSGKATKTNIEYEARQLAKSAKKGDKIFFFFAGHGYTLGGQNFLLAHDTRRDDIENTSVSLGHVFDLFDQSACRQVMFFLDCCHSGMRLADGTRGVLEDLSTEEIESHFAKAEFRVVFSACDKEEKSWPSLKFQHGYWTHHLLRALRGEEPSVLDSGGRLRSSDLQDYLSIAVPRDLVLQSTEKRRQNPKMFGDATGTFVVADLSGLLARIVAEREAQAGGLKNSTLRATEEGEVRHLAGFNKAKGHTSPKFQSDSSRSWVERLAEGDIATELEKVFENLKKSKYYKNKDIEYDEAHSGVGGIRTPDFEFSVSYAQSEDDPGQYIAVRELTRLDSPEILDEKWFNETFRGVFDEAVFELNGSINIAELINNVEDIDGFEVDFDAKRTFCSIQTSAFNGRIVITRNAITYEFQDAPTPQQMALQLQDAHALLLGTSELRNALPF